MTGFLSVPQDDIFMKYPLSENVLGFLKEIEIYQRVTQTHNLSTLSIRPNEINSNVLQYHRAVLSHYPNNCYNEIQMLKASSYTHILNFSIRFFSMLCHTNRAGTISTHQNLLFVHSFSNTKYYIETQKPYFRALCIRQSHDLYTVTAPEGSPLFLSCTLQPETSSNVKPNLKYQICQIPHIS